MLKMTILALMLAISNSAFAIDNFLEVKSGLYRGARPDLAEIETLKNLGVKTIVNLEDDEQAVAEEIAEAERLGIKIISLPMSPYSYPKTEIVDEALALIADDANYPIFVHCMHGEDRTGLIFGLYRVEQEMWEASRAYREMKDLGFHSILYKLKQYFKDRTGWKG